MADVGLPGGGDPTSELRHVTCHVGSHSVTYHPTQVNAVRVTQSCKLVLDLPTPEGWKAQLTYLVRTNSHL